MTPELIHCYTIQWHDEEKGVQTTMTEDPNEAESQARSGAHVTAESYPAS